jgi:flagellar protein FlbD
MAVNPDLIERAEATPDTVITMNDGHKLVVSESLPDLVALVRRWRAEVAAESFELSGLSATLSARPRRIAVATEDLEHGEDCDCNAAVHHDPEAPHKPSAESFVAHPSLGGKVVRLPFLED